MSKSIALRLVQGAKKADEEHTFWKGAPDFLHKVLHHHDPRVASILVGEHIGVQFDAEHAAEVEPLKLEQGEADERYANSLKHLNALEEKTRNTVPHIKRADIEGERPWKEWSAKDRHLTRIFIAALCWMTVISGSNVYAILQTSGNPVFLESPWLAICLSGLAPCIALSPKLFTTRMLFEKTRLRFSQSLYFLTGFVSLVWIVLFAITFDSISGDIDLMSYLEEDSGPDESWFVGVQLFAEILISATFFTAVDDISARYLGDLYIDNSEYLAALRAQQEYEPIHDVIARRRANIHGKLAKYQSQREERINEGVAEFIQLRTRISSLNSL